ncbi:MAG: hypothetical protein D6732_02440, partial [Methanobacteriota archaeon]
SMDILHERSWRLGNGYLEIRDTVSGVGRHRIEQFFHLHPDVYLEKDGCVIHLSWRESINKFAKFCPDSSAKIYIKSSTYHPEFGKEIPNQCVVCLIEAELPIILKTRIEWGIPEARL